MKVVIIIKIKVLLPRVLVTLTDHDYSVYAFWFSCSKDFKIILLSNILSLSVPHEGYSRNTSCALNLISTFLLGAVNFIYKYIWWRRLEWCPDVITYIILILLAQDININA